MGLGMARDREKSGHLMKHSLKHIHATAPERLEEGRMRERNAEKGMLIEREGKTQF